MSDVSDGIRAWAIRTSRDSVADRDFLWKELNQGKLRQGWGYSPEQDLRTIAECWRTGRPLSDDQRMAARHWRMLDEHAGFNANEVVCREDYIIVPNMPENGCFTLCQIKGGYHYEIPQPQEDFGHWRPVEIIQGGIPNDSAVVGADLRKSLRCRSRMWWLGHYEETLNALLDAVRTGRVGKAVSPIERARGVMDEVVSSKIAEVANELEKSLPRSLGNAEWEPVIAEALTPLLQRVEVDAVGGPAEQGADIEIKIPNPLGEQPWCVLVQIKDYEGEIDASVADQLQTAAESRRSRGERVVEVILLATNAYPSTELTRKLDLLSSCTGVQYSISGKTQLFDMLARAAVANSVLP